MSRPVIIFYDSDFPISNSIPSDAIKSMREFGTIVNANQLAATLKETEGGCFINLHAPYFPKAAWIDILAYLQRGGGLISIGGAPSNNPFAGKMNNGMWKRNRPLIIKSCLFMRYCVLIVLATSPCLHQMSFLCLRGKKLFL